ncbi:hypothetical protein ASE86_01495 [Sphingomonas sp. Leaf33]|uniref:flagellar hook-associated protein FlgK n=1 Tax=Sphingomonas sp. Leaf33 TaxID=1736215 RepID=UPI0006F54877|nr:flagellar hook-associated protein FlgK [Sphingomonas sp. Leaf33]KQN24977.1 hypothetical protein ASE86_01495 [Sphingomonas sp. Leaf33]
MTDLLGIGVTGVRAYQTALSTTSENISNAATPGYSRRTAVVEEFRTTGIAGIGQMTLLAGGGVRIAGVTRAADDFRAAQARTTGSDVARSASGVAWIDRIEGALSGNQLSDRLITFFASAKNVAADPSATAPRTVLLEDARSLAAGFNSTGRALAGAADELAAQGRDMAAQLGDLGTSMVRINQGLTRAAEGSSARAQLLDERDRTLESMSALVDVDTSFDSLGRAVVRAGGSAGPVIADVERSAVISFVTNASGEAAIAASGPAGHAVVPATGGAMAGLVDGALKIAGARERLNTIATDFVGQMNDWQAQGKTLTGAAGPAMFGVAAGAAPTEISVVLDDPRGVAAAYGTEGARGNGNLTRLVDLRASAGWETRFDDLTTENAALLKTRRGVVEAQTAIHGAATAARDEMTGVDLDEEAVNLIRFQQAYQASSRIIQVARDILQTIIDIR